MGLVWKGTIFDVFFSRCNLIVLLTMGTIFMSVNIAMIFVLKGPEKESISFDTFFIRIQNMLTVMYLVCTYVYYGWVKRQFKYKEEPIIDEN